MASRLQRSLALAVQQQGYRGPRTTVLRYIGQLRHAAGVAPRTRTLQATPPVVDPSVDALTPRQATWLVLRHPDPIMEREAALLNRLRDLSPAVVETIGLGQTVAHLLRSRGADRWEEWLTHAAQGTLPPFHRVAKSFRRDLDAINAGLTGPQSTGPVEGHINRLKLVKRQMCGRAKLDLLANRFLAQPRPLSRWQICCTEMKSLTQQSVRNQPSWYTTELHPIDTVAPRHENHQQWP